MKFEDKLSKSVAKSIRSSMNVNIPETAIEHFWEENNASEEFWSFRFKPPCEVGYDLIFRYNRKPIATAKVLRIEKPGQSKCLNTGKFGNGWKVIWDTKTFKKL